MRFFILFLAMTMVGVCAEKVSAQCGGQGGGGGSMAGTSGGTLSSGGALLSGGVTTGTLLTGPGSAYYEDMMTMRMQQAYMQQQYMLAYAKAQAKAARREKIRQTILAQREKELAERGKYVSPGEILARQ